MALWLSSLLMFLGRICLGTIFVWSAFDKLVGFNLYTTLLDAQGIGHPVLFLIGALLIELVGGLALMLGWFARFAAVVLLIYMLPATFIFHDFWVINESAEKHIQTIFFLKNVAIFGGLLYVLACGTGRFCFYYRGGKNHPDKL